MTPPDPQQSPAGRLAAIESLDDIVIGVDRELRVTSWNGAAERFMDRPAGSALGGALMTMITPSLRLSFKHLPERALTGDVIARQGLTMMRQDGSEVVMSVAIAPIAGGDGRPAGLILLGHDVGEHQRLQ